MWRRRAAIPIVAGVVAATTAGVTVALLRDPPPVPTESVTLSAEELDLERVEEPEPELEELNAQQLAERYGSAVWKVETSGCGIDASGSAFAIDATTLITNWHVVVTDPAPTLVHRDGTTRREGTVIGWSDQPDVAVITVEDPVDDWMSFTEASELAEGQTLVGLGYPAPATDFTVTASSILSFQTDGDVRQAIRADGLLDKGNSGGPVLTTTGQVAGVVTELADNRSGVQLVPLAYTYDHLRATIDRIVNEPAEVEADCAAAGLRPELPDGWESGQLPGSGSDDYGDDAALDRLWDLCEDGDWDACDDLYWDSPIGSGYEAYGASCGDRDWWWGFCAVFMSNGSSSGSSSGNLWPDDPDGYGDDSTLDRLWDRCADGAWDACDDLYWDSPIGSGYEAYGASCGDRDSWWGSCAEFMPNGSSSGSGSGDLWPDDPDTYGDDATFDRLWDRCADGALDACDDLYWDSPLGSRYEDFGATCGDRQGWTPGDCVASTSVDTSSTGLRAGCGGGDWAACDDLYWTSPIDSDDEAFGATCGDRESWQAGTCVERRG